jgi:adhesin/invasin
VTVQIASGDGSLRGTTSRQTDGDGRVAFDDLAIVGAPGSRTLIFAAAGYASAISTPVSLGVGPPATVAVAAGADQTAPAGSPVPVRPAVIVRDAGGTAVANVPVTFAVASGGGSVSGGSTTTGADGIARSGDWTLGTATGTNTLTATVGADGVSGNPVTFTATGVTGTPSAAQSSVTASPGSIAASAGESSSTITVVVRDARGNPVPGQAVTLTAGGAGVSLQQPGATDAAGTTTGRFSATAAGAHTVTAAVGDTPLGSTDVVVTPGTPSAARSAAQVPAGAAGVATVVTLTLEDQFGNPVSGAAGQIGVAVTGANPGAAVAIADVGGGAYRASYTPLVVGVDQVDIRVAGVPVAGSPFASTVTPGPGDPGHTVASVPDGNFATPLEIVVQVRDAGGNPVGHGGDAVQITPEDVSPLGVTDNGDGTYRAVWVPFRLGQVRIAITLNGTPIAGSPLVSNISFFR